MGTLRRVISQQPPVAPANVDDFNQIIEYRAAVMTWAAEIMSEIAQYVSGFEGVVRAGDIPNIALGGPTGLELSARTDLSLLSTAIGDKTEPIINALLTAIENVTVSNPPTMDIQGIVTNIETVLDKELNPNDPLSIYSLREVIRSYVASILLDSAFEILATDTTNINSEITAFKTNAKSQLDDKMFVIERRELNSLAMNSTLDSEIGATAISRINARKGRLYTEIDNQAEVLRQEKIEAAYERAFERQKTRIASMSLLPTQLPDGLIGILKGIILIQFIDPSAFIAQLPGILGFATDGFKSVAGMYQEDRFKDVDVDLNSIQAHAQFLNVIVGNLSQIAQAVGKFATMEAS